MRPLTEFPATDRSRIEVVLTDIDDTLTQNGLLPSVAYGALERLRSAGLIVVPITGRPAGWCDLIARLWPVDGVIGENGAFYFHYDRARQTMIRCFQKSAAERATDRARLESLAARILAEVPGARISADQGYRETDLAIDFAEDVPPLPRSRVDRILDLFTDAGATAKVSSIHVNGWYGAYDKLAMAERMLVEIFGRKLTADDEGVVFVGDSPNDEPMFAHLLHGVAVANFAAFADQVDAKPRWITNGSGGAGFAELANALLESRGG
ncbi:MAG TPA: HAD-IIB family hydrolase [Alphaproteobacteria bacterium]|nr:HAD-IIB family hydrolase [Alphaproteobacteria bacterium]